MLRLESGITSPQDYYMAVLTPLAAKIWQEGGEVFIGMCGCPMAQRIFTVVMYNMATVRCKHCGRDIEMKRILPWWRIIKWAASTYGLKFSELTPYGMLQPTEKFPIVLGAEEF